MPSANMMNAKPKPPAASAGQSLSGAACKAALCALLLFMASGCASTPSFLNLFGKEAPFSAENPLSEDNRLLASAWRIFNDPGPAADKAAGELEQGLDLYRRGKFVKAAKQFHRVAYGKHTPPQIAEKALFFEGESYRMQQRYPDAAQIYTKLVMEFPRRTHHYDALQRMFDIANYWLDETRDEMISRNKAEKKKEWFIQPVGLYHFIHFDKTKPTFDMEGHALNLLEKVYLNDLDGPLGEKAMFFLGSVHFFRRDYREADHYFYQVVTFHKDGKYAPKAMELSIMCKQLIPGGPEYDGRKVAEARELVHQAANAYPVLANEKSDFLERQLYSIHAQQAAQDLMIGKFYQRTGHPASAYFYYAIVCQRYAGTKYAKDAARRMERLKRRADRQARRGSWNLWDQLQFWQSPAGQRATENSGRIPPSTPEALDRANRPELAPPPRPLPSGNNGPVQPGRQWP